MPARSSLRRRGLAGAALVALALAGLGVEAPTEARAAATACANSTEDAYALAVRALTGPEDTDVELRVAPAPGCAVVGRVKHVQIKTFGADGGLVAVRNAEDVQVRKGAAVVTLARVPRGRRIAVHALVQTGEPARTYVLDRATTSKLRPDLVVGKVTAPAQTLTTRPLELLAQIEELNGDTAAEARVSLSGVLGPLGEPLEVEVPAGGEVTVTFPPLALATSASYELTVTVDEAEPGETDGGNNSRSTTVEVTTHELAPRVVLPSLGGFGFQFNQHVYAPITNPPPATLPDLESKVKELEPQLVRIFYNERWDGNADGQFPEWQQNLESLYRTVELAHDAGATIVIAYQTIGTARNAPVTWMNRFADVLHEAIVVRGYTNVRWATVGNEINTTTLPVAQYETMVRALDTALEARGIRDDVKLLGGDLVQNTEGTAGGHRAWFTHMVEHMNDVIDGWSEHIYWRYDQSWRMEERLKDVAWLTQRELPEEARKPTLLMEYGVRGFDTCGTKPVVKFAYYPDAGCTELRRMPLAGFHKLWFSINAAQLGFDGAANWDLYWGVYDRTNNPPNQSFWAIGPPQEGWALYPSYHALRLLLQTTALGWQVLAVEPFTPDDEAARYDAIVRDTLEQELTAFRGPGGQLTLFGLDSRGGLLTAPSETVSTYSIGGLPKNATFTLALWNAAGNGENTVAGPVSTGPAGVARFEVPLHAAFTLTTVPVS